MASCLLNHLTFPFKRAVTSYVFSVPMAFYNVYACKTKKQPNFWEATRPLVSLVLLFKLSVIWAIYSPNAVIYNDPRSFYLLVGTIFSNIAVSLCLPHNNSFLICFEMFTITRTHSVA